jgi:hypothetical protein
LLLGVESLNPAEPKKAPRDNGIIQILQIALDFDRIITVFDSSARRGPRQNRLVPSLAFVFP